MDTFGKKGDVSLSPSRYAEFLKTVFDAYYNDFMSGNYISIRDFDNYVRILAGQPAECCGMMGQCSCNFTLESDGSVYPCDFYVLDEYRLGSIHESSFEQLKNTPTAQKFIAPSLKIHEKCRQCEHFSLCLGGCRRNREPFADSDTPSLNRFCEAYLAFFDYARPRLEHMARMVSN